MSFTWSLKKEKKKPFAMMLLYWLTIALCIGVLVFPSSDGCIASKLTFPSVFIPQIFPKKTDF